LVKNRHWEDDSGRDGVVLWVCLGLAWRPREDQGQRDHKPKKNKKRLVRHSANNLHSMLREEKKEKKEKKRKKKEERRRKKDSNEST